MSTNPWDAITPIGAPREETSHATTQTGLSDATSSTSQPAHLASISNAEKQRRRERTRANAEDKAGREHARDGDKKRRWSRRPLRVGELLAMCSEAARRFHADAVSPLTKLHEAKHAGVGLGVMVDKLNALSGRPTEILGVTDDVRPAAHDLASKLAVVRRHGVA